LKSQNSAENNHLPIVSMVIVNFRSWGKLQLCLDSLIKYPPRTAKLSIVVVDNCSNDDKFAAFEKQFPDVKFLLNKGNLGFANGCNTGAKTAKGDYLLFINPDTELTAGAVDELLNTIQKFPPYSIVATNKCKTNGKYERMERFFPRWYTLTGLGKSLHRLLIRKQLDIDFDKNKELVFPEWLSGSVIFIRQQDFENLAGWNEKFWMYSEDVDLCKRAVTRGGKMVLLQNVTITHNHGGSSRINPETTALTKTEVFISRHTYISIHESGVGCFLMQTFLVLKSLLKTALVALLTLALFNHPKAKVSRLIFYKLCCYYLGAAKRGSWISPRSSVFN
jgi:GT2 family glycosyltransferase